MLQNLLLALSLTGCIGVSSLNDYNVVERLPVRNHSTINISTLSSLPLGNYPAVFDTGYSFTFEGYDDTIYGRVGFAGIGIDNPYGYFSQDNLNTNLYGLANIAPGFANSIYQNNLYQYTLTYDYYTGDVLISPFFNLKSNTDSLNIYLILGKTNVKFLGFLVFYQYYESGILDHYVLDYHISYDTNVYPRVAIGTFEFANLHTGVNWYNVNNIIRPTFSNMDLPFTQSGNSLDYNISLNLHYSKTYIDYLQTSNYNAGFQDAYDFFDDNTLINLFWSIADTPVIMLKSLFLSDFSILGVSLFGLLTGMLTLVLVTWIIRKLL